ncbi:MAG: MFS transporter [Akkermansia sp.]
MVTAPLSNVALPHARHSALLLTMSFICTMLTFINMGCITAATPDLSGTFVVGTLDVSWSGAACPLGTALAFTGATYLWSRIGLRRALRLALMLICFGAVLGLIADHFLIMIFARFLQGIGGGLALVYATGLLNEALPQEARKLPMGLRMCSIGLASCSSPVLGCILVQYSSWRGLFVGIGIISAILCLLTSLYVPNQKIPKSGKFDWVSFFFLGMGCVCILMVIIYGEIDGWNAGNVLAWMYGGFCSFLMLVVSCLSHKTPLLDFRILGNWRFLFALLASLCNIFCICWIRVGTVQYMRNVMNYEPIQIARVFIVLVLSFCVGAAIVLPLMQKGKIALRVGMMSGLLGLGGAAFLLSRVDDNCSWIDVACPLSLFGIGYAFCLIIATPLALRGVPPSRASTSARTLNTIRYIFISMYVSSVSTVLAHMKTDFHFTVAEHVREEASGTAYTLDFWQRNFISEGKTPAEVHAAVDALLQKAVSLQSQIFSVDYFYLCTVMVGAAGVLFTVLCLKLKPESERLSAS